METYELCISKSVPQIHSSNHTDRKFEIAAQGLASTFIVLTRPAACPLQISALTSRKRAIARILVDHISRLATSMPCLRRVSSCRTRSMFRGNNRAIISVISKTRTGILRNDPRYRSMAVCESEDPPRCHSRMRLRLKDSNFHSSVDHCYR
jgi:hypothetical protein